MPSASSREGVDSEFGLWLPRFYIPKHAFCKDKAEKATNDICSFFCFTSISRLSTHSLMFNEPPNKVETTILFYHLAIFDLLSNVPLHMKQFHSFVLRETLGKQVLKLCAFRQRKLFWHDTIAPSSKHTARNTFITESCGKSTDLFNFLLYTIRDWSGLGAFQLRSAGRILH